MAACSAGCKEEFKRSNFLLDFPSPQYFVTSQWDNCACTSVFYLVYRILIFCGLATIVLFTLVLPGVDEYQGYLLFIYLTNLSFLTLVLSALLECILVIDGFVRYRKSGGAWDKVYPSMPWYLKMNWVLNNVSSCSAFIVTLLFYLMFRSVPFAQSKYLLHAVNSIYVFVNAFVTATPVRIYHVFHCMIYVTFYVIFTVIYQLVLGMSPIYPLLDWKDPLNATWIAVVAVVVAPTGVWLVYYSIYRLRLVIYDHMVNKVDPPAQDSEKNGFVSTVDCTYNYDDPACKQKGGQTVGQENYGFGPVDPHTTPENPKYVSKVMVQF